MKRTFTALLLSTLILALLCSACSKKKNEDKVQPENNEGETAAELTVDRIAGYLGKTKDEIKSIFNDGAGMVENDANMYQRNIYGKDAKVKITYDDNEKIERFHIYTTEANYETWKTKLDELYGTYSETEGWNKNDVHVKTEREGDQVVLVVERPAK